MSQMELNKKGWYDLHAENQLLIYQLAMENDHVYIVL